MIELVIVNLYNKKIVCDSSQTVLKNIQEAQIDWLQACGGKGRCTTCAMRVIAGEKNLTELTVFEQKQQESQRLQANERLACQCKMLGNIMVEVPQRLQLPHQTYGFLAE
jgi:2Fe-2S ferredoxin